jgi:hypothetical protein
MDFSDTTEWFNWEWEGEKWQVADNGKNRTSFFNPRTGQSMLLEEVVSKIHNVSLEKACGMIIEAMKRQRFAELLPDDLCGVLVPSAARAHNNVSDTGHHPSKKRPD